MNKILKAQKYMYENITGEDYENKHLTKLLEIIGHYPISKCKRRERNDF